MCSPPSPPTIHASPASGEPDLLGDADRRLAAGEITAAEHPDVSRRRITIVLKEQELSGLGILTDGDVAHEDRLRRPRRRPRWHELRIGVVALPDGAAVHAPRFDQRPPGGRRSRVDAWQWADGAADIPLKQVLIGPYTIARLAEPGGARREVLALGLAEALNAELRALAAAGCPIIQVDEGALTSIGDDEAEWAPLRGRRNGV